MAAIVFINTQKSGSSREALKAAGELGYDVILLTNRLSFFKNSDSFPEVKEIIYCDTSNFQSLKERIGILKDSGVEIATIISFVEPDVAGASALADAFGVGVFSTETIKLMQDKALSRNALKDTPYNPWYQVLNIYSRHLDSDIFNHLPIVIKNPKSTGSKEVYLVKTPFELCERLDYLLRKRSKKVLIEEYLEGPQYLVETLVVNGNVHIVAVIEQDVELYEGHSIIVGYTVKVDYSLEFYNSLARTVKDIIKSLGMENGPCHLELRYVEKRWKLIEINPRISGSGMNELLRYSLGVNLVKETLKLALNEEVNLTPKFQLYTHAEYLTSPLTGRLLKVMGRNEVLSSEGVISVFVKPRTGQMIEPPYSMGNRYAYVIASGKSELDARILAKTALKKLKLHVFQDI